MRYLLPAVLLALTTLTGCSSSDEPSAGVTVYDGPEISAAAQAPTREGAVAFAEHYVATYNYARRTGDLNGLIPLEADECFTCQQVRHDLAGIYDAGGWITGGAWSLRTPVAQPSDTIDGWVITADVGVRPGVVSPASAEPERTPATTTRITLEISRAEGQWEVLRCDKEV